MINQDEFSHIVENKTIGLVLIHENRSCLFYRGTKHYRGVAMVRNYNKLWTVFHEQEYDDIDSLYEAYQMLLENNWLKS